MPEKIEGIILDSIRFRENSVIAKIYTKDGGAISILIKGLSNRKNKLSLVSLQPLTHIECQLYFRDNRSINKVTDIVVLNSPFGIVNNIVKNSIAIFIAEIVLRTSKDSLKDHHVYVLLMDIISILSVVKNADNSLHVYFVIKYLEILGFKVDGEPAREYFKEEVYLIEKLQQLSVLKEFEHVEMTKSERKHVLSYLLHSLRSNLGMFDMQSYRILEEVMM